MEKKVEIYENKFDLYNTIKKKVYEDIHIYACGVCVVTEED